MNFERARFNMVEQQIRPWEVLDRAVLDLLERAPREAFVPKEFRRLAYADIAVPIGDGEAMLPPRVEGRLLQALRIGPEERVLEIGTGSGFLTWLLAQRAAHVTSIELDPTLAELARTNLAAQGVGNVTVEVGDGRRGWKGGTSYDAIAVGGSVPVPEPAFEAQLAVGGRLFVVVGTAPAMEAMLVRRAGEGEWIRECMFETVLPPLHGSETPQRFVL
ncbi:MAG: protein-L-isoaspartate O-methyltransferase [Gammaproteobacteria bacterium]|nr:protein-L-isoaspartate O-methyltransferase [Gammaproteobacteria bacterium]